MEKPSKVVVFFPTARMVSFFAEFFQEGFEHPIIELHSKKSQSARNTASDKFRRAKNAILFTSDLSARGIDWPDCTTVIQVGSPESRDQYIHRLGRTARAGKDGTGLLVLLPFEAQFLSELRGLQVIPNQDLAQLLLQPSAHSEPEWVAQRLSRIQSGGNKLSASAQLAYLSFLGYYLGQAHRIRCDKAEIVQVSNAFSTAIGLAHVPRIPQKLISKMELGGVPGVFIEEEEA
jgi:ATP-dependent RNA helicase MSS116